MFSTLTTVEAVTILGVTAPECDGCEGSGTMTYLLGPYEHTRECEACLGVGRRLPCPTCADGTDPATEDTCTTCEGFTFLT